MNDAYSELGYFLGSELSEPVSPEKQLAVFTADDKIQTFKWKREFWKTSICHCELAKFTSGLLKAISDETGGNINKCDFLETENEKTFNVWKRCYFSMNQYFPNDWYRRLENPAWLKDPADFNVPEYKKLNDRSSDSILPIILHISSVNSDLVLSKNTKSCEKAITIFLPFKRLDFLYIIQPKHCILTY